jgi:putative membrane-bound dehydrogenase-like protein
MRQSIPGMISVALAASALALPAIGAEPAIPVRDGFAHEGLAPAEAAAAMTVPDGFKVTLFAGEPDVVQPIAMAIDDRGRLWVAEAYSYPVRVPDDKARDRILIFEDADGDGRFDKRTVFAERLNLVSGLEVGFGGAWVGAAPNLLFIPDADGDDRPDGPPRVLLDGWGYQDTHETLNSFAWGPDGWLYGCHGVFTHSRVGKPGTPDAERVPINAGIWRYHPSRHTFEVFAHGTSNPWGLDWDEHGQAFLTSCVIPHLYHVIPGGRYERQAGQHFNPYTYDDIKTIADHRHYAGNIREHAWWGQTPTVPKATMEAGGGHAHAGAMIYLGGAWPDEYRGSLFMNNIHGARLNRDRLAPRGSGFVGSHAPDFLLANDRWSQIISLKYGPDGNAYMIDWYDKNQCHHRDVDGHDRTNGRIFKVSYGDARPAAGDLSKLASLKLAELLKSRNEWEARHARRILQERGPDPVVQGAALEFAFGQDDPTVRLRGLWTLHAVGGLARQHFQFGASDRDPHVRAWTVRLFSEDGFTAPDLLGRPERFAEMARTDRSPVVRLALASAMQRLPAGRRWEIVAGLLQHGEDADDPNLPLMDWYAAEPLAVADPSRALSLALDSKIPLVRSFLSRRVAAIGTPEAIALVVDRLGKTDDPAARLALLEGLNEALKGRRRVAMPSSWPATSRAIEETGEPRARALADALSLTFGEPRASGRVRGVLADRSRPLDDRKSALAALLKVGDPELPATLQALLDEAAIRGQAIRALASYDDPKTPGLLVAAFPRLTPAERRDALNTLAARPDYAHALLAAVEGGRIAARDLSADVIRQLRALKDAGLDRRIGQVWGSARETTADRAKLIARYKATLTRAPAQPPDPSLGRAVFARTCQQCHTLFGVGGKVGPDLTGSNRADLEYLLSNVLDPDALIGKDYQAHVIATANGRVLTGIIRAEDADAVTLVSANDIVVIPKGEIEERRPSDKSMMPDDLWSPLSEHEVRSLVAYLASPAQVPMLATPDNVLGFFNGRDLSGWEGDHNVWTVEDGEIVGRTSAGSGGADLRGEMLVGDFRLSLKVKLVGDRGRAGIRFGEQTLPDGKVRGYRAGVGPGRWCTIEGGRGRLGTPSGEVPAKAGEWNTYEIVAVGSRVRVSLNGRPCTQLDDPSGPHRGTFAFQIDPGGPTEVRFKEIRLELDPGREAATGRAP